MTKIFITGLVVVKFKLYMFKTTQVLQNVQIRTKMNSCTNLDLFSDFQLFREVRIMKMLDHPNIGE